MNVNNTLQKQNTVTLVDYLSKDKIKNQISAVVGKNEVQRFITSIISATNVNPELKDCTKQSILAAALLGETLKLSPSPQLGQYYMIPFWVKNQKKAQFVLGYKGYLQLAIRTGFYKKINVIAIKQGELIFYDPLEESIEVNLISDFEERENAETIGYYAYIEYINGFRKSLYWSKSKMLEHAKRYSTAFNRDIQNGTKYSFWSSEFDAMAYKTMLRQILSKWGNLNYDMQQAFESDMAIIEEDGSKTYVDNFVNMQEKDNNIEQKTENNIVENKTEEQIKQSPNSAFDALFN
jgi:recombination protein RecT